MGNNRGREGRRERESERERAGKKERTEKEIYRRRAYGLYSLFDVIFSPPANARSDASAFDPYPTTLQRLQPLRSEFASTFLHSFLYLLPSIDRRQWQWRWRLQLHRFHPPLPILRCAYVSPLLQPAVATTRYGGFFVIRCLCVEMC